MIRTRAMLYPRVTRILGHTPVLRQRQHRCCRAAAHAEGLFGVRGRCGDCSRHAAPMKSFAVLALMAIVASCRLDTFFRGSGGGAPPVAGPPANLRFMDQPQTTPARKTLPPVRVAVRDDQGNVVAGFAGLVSVTLDSSGGGGGVPLGDTTTVAAANGIATVPPLRVDPAGTRHPLPAPPARAPLAPPFRPGVAP